MRAKLINEVQKFERGISPKAAMDIGGISLEDIYIETVMKGFREWGKQLDSLKGKKVTFKPDGSQYLSDEYKSRKTLILDDVSYTRNGDVTFFTEQGSYHVDTSEKIYIE